MAERTFDLSLNPATAVRLAQLLKDYDADIEYTDDDTGDERHGDADEFDADELDMLEGHDEAEDPLAEEVEALVESMNVDAERDLVALLWLGRGDFTAEEWSDARHRARERVQGGTAQYLLETPLAADYIEEGLTALGYDLEDFNQTEV